MADTAVLRVDVASADFDKFQAAFNAYAKTLDQTLASWAKITNEVKAASSAMSNMAAPVAKSTASLQKFTQQFQETAKHTASIRSNVESITKGLTSWKTAVGSTLALLGIGGGIAGLNAIISGAVADRNRALAQGIGYGQARQAGSMPGGGAMMAGWGTARWDPTSMAYRGAQTLFGQDTQRQLNRDDPRAFTDALNKATQYLGQFDEAQRGAIAATSHLNDFLGTEALRTWETLTEQAKKGNKAAQEELDVRTRAYIAQGEAAKQAEEGVRKWSTFYVTLESTRSVIQDTLIDKLSPLAPQLTKLAESTNTAVAAFLTAPAVQEAITDLAKSIGDFAKYLDSPEAKEAIKGFTDSVATAYHTLKDINDKFMALQQWLSDHSLLKGVQWLTGAREPTKEEQSKQDVPGQANSVPGAISRWWNKGTSDKAPAGFGNAAWTPAPTLAAGAIGGQDSRMGEQMMQWFGQESMATQKAADAAERRDTKLERLLTSMENWFKGGQELQPKGIGSMNWGGLASKFAPPWARGAYNTLRSTPAETGELPERFWPGGSQGAAMPGGGAPPMIRQRGGAAGGGGMSGAPVAGRAAKGTLAKNQAEAYQAARSAGLSDSSARALVANMSGEALNKPGDVHWDVSHYAHGIVQWDDKRSKRIEEHFGKAPQDMSVADQTKAAIWEMQSDPSYKKSWDALQSDGSTASKVGTLVSNYERPADTAGATHTRLGYLAGLPSQFSGAGGGAGGAAGAVANATPNSVSEVRGPGGGNAGDANALLAEVKKTHPHLSNEQCVTLVREYSGMGGTVKDWRKGQNAMSGNLQVGQPIATFMSASGQQSERYDAGGIGTPGAGTSHAALFGGYTRDKQGNITGMNVVEQYSKSGGPRVQHYGVGGFGEHGTQNYYAIAKEGAKQQSKMAGGLDNDNWQQKPINHVQVHNRSGSDVHIAASTVMTSV